MLTPGLLAGFIGIVLVLLVALFVGTRNLQRVYATSEAVVHTYSVKAALQQLLATTVDAETGERGFIITGEASYLEPYERARRAAAEQVGAVRALIAGEEDQRADADALAAAVTLKLEELAEAIRERRTRDFAAAQATVGTNVGKRTMDQMRARVSRMEAREDALLAVRTAQAGRSYQTAQSTRIVTASLALLSVVGLFFGTLRYADERRRAERAAGVQQAQLREALQLKDEFVTLVSHELRTPTNTIAGWARMLEEGAVGPERSAHAVAAISRNAQSLRQLIDDLMDTSQLVSGRMRLDIASVDIALVVQDAIDAVRLGADNKGVVLASDVPPSLPLIRGDAVRLKQVVWNLLANAIKFTPKGGSVTVALELVDHGLQLEVQDTGDGIEATFLPHVFERYRQADARLPGGARGVGLGLAIVRHLVELHGGTVTARSAGLGQGATFLVELPLSVPAARADAPTWSEVDHV